MRWQHQYNGWKAYIQLLLTWTHWWKSSGLKRQASAVSSEVQVKVLCRTRTIKVNFPKNSAGYPGPFCIQSIDADTQSVCVSVSLKLFILLHFFKPVLCSSASYVLRFYYSLLFFLIRKSPTILLPENPFRVQKVTLGWELCYNMLNIL